MGTGGDDPSEQAPSGEYLSEEAISAALERVRESAIGLPEVTERLSHGSPTFFVRGKKTFINFVDDHHGDGVIGIWCAAPAGVQEQLVETEPERFYRPAYVGHRGWLGVRLDVDVDWEEIDAVIEDAYRCVAPKKLVAELDERAGEAAS